MRSETERHLSAIAYLLALVWAGWWILFGLLSGLGEGLDLLGVAVHTAVPGLIFLVITLIAMRWQDIGGALLVLTGICVLLLYPALAGSQVTTGTLVFMLLTMALPPLVAGGLCLACWRSTLHPGSS